MSLEEVQALYEALSALGHSVCWLRRARDLAECSGIDPQIAASLHALGHAAEGLLGEMGATFRAQEHAPNATTRVYAGVLLDRLRAGEPAAPPTSHPHTETLDA